MSDGVPCEPGTVIISQAGQMWICDGGQYNPSKPGPPPELPDCPPRSLLRYNSQLNVFECIEYSFDGTTGPEVHAAKPHSIDPVTVMLVGLAVAIAGALGMGLSQWWRNRKAKKVEAQPSVNWESLLETPAKVVAPATQFDTHNIVETKEGTLVADPVDKNPDSLQDEIKEIYMQIQLGRGEINKIPGFVQICVNSALTHLNKARDMVASLGGKVK
jgi:hypothetical protein